LEAEVFLNVLRTAPALVGGLAEVLGPLDVTQSQYNVLRILRGPGPAGLRCGEVGERMVNREPDVSRLLDRMERRGLVARARAPGDQRVVTACLTSDARRVVAALDEPVGELHRHQLGHLDAATLHAPSDLLEAARDPASAIPERREPWADAARRPSTSR
jgi:DNA-binding MarR family transcriptional regulator